MRDWGRELYLRVLDELRVAAGGSLVDVGCGGGQLCRLAAGRGARVTGIDTDPAVLARAGDAVPGGRFLRADLHELPLPPGEASATSCVQVLMHLPNPLAALRELHRVAAPGGRVAVTVWGPPETCAVGAFGDALAPVLGPPPWRVDRGRTSGPPPLHAEGRLARLTTLAGLTVTGDAEVRCAFDYPGETELLTTLYAADIGRRAIALAGRRPVRRAVLDGLASHRLADGGYRLWNTFRMVVGER
ncbi:MAG TPA: class I SAM-dependent methyltransferase [Pseudonocardia sp.]